MHRLRAGSQYWTQNWWPLTSPVHPKSALLALICYSSSKKNLRLVHKKSGYRSNWSSKRRLFLQNFTWLSWFSLASTWLVLDVRVQLLLLFTLAWLRVEKWRREAERWMYRALWQDSGGFLVISEARPISGAPPTPISGRNNDDLYTQTFGKISFKLWLIFDLYSQQVFLLSIFQKLFN